MDGRTWLWRKRSSEKTIATVAQVPGMSADTLHEEAGKIQKRAEEAEPPLPGRSLNEKLASVLLECHVRGDLATIEEELAEESSAGQAMEETEADCLRRKLVDALRQGAAVNERLAQSELALKQCKQPLSTLQEEQEQTKDALMKASKEFLIAQKVLEEKLKETSKRLTNVVVENTNMSKALLIKERLIDELHKHVAQKAAESNVLMVRLEASEKENAFLKYEIHIFEKELENRNEELEYNRHSIDASSRQHAENVQRISRLEAECQRLQSLTKKRLPGPANSGWDRSHSRRKSNPVRDLILRDTTIDKSPAMSPEDVSFYLDQLRIMEEDNSILKGLLNKKNAQLQSTRTMYSLTASRLSEAEARVLELSRSDEGVCSAGSCANALITDSVHFKDEKLKSPLIHKTSRPSEMSLMDDFVEMERLAMVSFQAPGAGSRKHLQPDTGLVSIVEDQSGGITENVEIQCRSAADEVPFDWLQEVLKAISKQQRITKRSLPELIQDIKIAVGCIDQTNSQAGDGKMSVRNRVGSNHGGYITWRLPYDTDSSTKEPTTEEFCRPKLSESISKIIKLIEQMTKRLSIWNAPSEGKKEESILPLAVSEEYFIQTFQWRNSEFSPVLERFVNSCNGLLGGKISLEIFVENLHCTLEWIMSSAAPSDTSSTRDKIKRHSGWGSWPSQTEGEVAMISEERPSRLSSSHYQEENRRLKDELKNLESAKTDVEVRLQSAMERADALAVQLQGSEERIGSLQVELESLKESKGMLEDQLENQKSINEDLDTQLTVAKAKLNEVLQKFSSLEVELEDKGHCCEELEATCLDLQLELESTGKKEALTYDSIDDEKQTRHGWELAAVPARLAECQETTLDFGRQLKALASPATRQKTFTKHFSLRDQMLAEDNAKAIILRSPREDAAQTSSFRHTNSSRFVLVQTPYAYFSSKNQPSDALAGALAIVPSRKQGFGLFRKLLMRRNKGSNKKARPLVKA